MRPNVSITCRCNVITPATGVFETYGLMTYGTCASP